MRKLMLIGISVYFTLVSCKKEDNKSLPTSNYFPIAIGNYWVFNIYQHDLKTSKDSLVGTDSLFIKNDTIINNNKYYILSEKGFMDGFSNNSLLRDSDNCIIEYRNNATYTFLSFNNFKDTLVKWHKDNETPIINGRFSKMYKITNNVEVPAGKFNDIIDRRNYTVLNKKSSCGKDSILIDYYFANNVGPISFSFTYIDPFLNCDHQFDFKLVRYKIKED